MTIKSRTNLTGGKSDPIPCAATAGAVHIKPDQPNDATSFRNMAEGRNDKPRMYEAEHDLSLRQRRDVNTLLNLRLADALDLQMQMKMAHWNVKGPSFIGLHELFDKVARAAESYVDLIAERIVQLGGIAEGTVRMAASRTRLEEYPLDIADGLAHVEGAAKALSTFSREARQIIIQADELGDVETGDLFSEMSRGVDKWLWFVKAHSQASK